MAFVWHNIFWLIRVWNCTLIAILHEWSNSEIICTSVSLFSSRCCKYNLIDLINWEYCNTTYSMVVEFRVYMCVCTDLLVRQIVNKFTVGQLFLFLATRTGYECQGISTRVQPWKTSAQQQQVTARGTRRIIYTDTHTRTRRRRH